MRQPGNLKLFRAGVLRGAQQPLVPYEIDFTSYIDIIALIIVLPGLYYTFVAVSACVRCFLPRLSIATKKSPLFFR